MNHQPARPAHAAHHSAPAAEPGGKRLRVLHVFKYVRPDFSGDAVYWERMAKPLRDYAVTTQILATQTAPGANAAPGVRYAGGSLARALRLLRAASRDTDVVHFHGLAERYFLLPLLARLLGRQVVLSCTLDDGLGMILRGYRPRYRPLVRRLCRLCFDAVIAISPRLHADNEGVLPETRRHLIGQGVSLAAPPQNPDLKRAARAQFSLPADGLVLLYVGGITPRKDVRFLTAAHDPAHHLLIVGPVLDDAYAAALAADVHAIGQTAHMHGYMDDPSPAYSAADIFVFASHAEGFGNVLIEAMAAGLPVVARRLPGVTDSFITDGVSGLLFDDAAGYRRAIAALANDADLRQRLGKAAREAAAAYALPAIAARYRALYADLCAP